MPTMKLLAFGLHTLLEMSDPDYQRLGQAVDPQRKFFQHLEALTACPRLANRAEPMNLKTRDQEFGRYAAPKN